MQGQAQEQELTWQQQRAIEEAVSRSKRKIWTAYLLAIFLGGFGMHRFYVKRNWTGATMLALTLFWIALNGLFFGDGDTAEMLREIARYAVGLWILVDLFLIPWMVRKCNAGLEAEVTRKFLEIWNV